MAMSADARLRRALVVLVALAVCALPALAQDAQRNLDQIGVTRAFTASGHNGAGVSVAIMDGAPNTAHPYEAGRLFAFKNYGGVYSSSPPANGDAWHAQHIAGTIGSGSDYMRGIAPAVNIHAYAIRDDRGQWLAKDYGHIVLDHMRAMNGVRWNIRAVNMSFACNTLVFCGANGAELNVFDDYANDFVIVHAAGNAGVTLGLERYAGNASVALRHVLIVGSVGTANGWSGLNVISDFSNRPGEGCFALSLSTCQERNKLKYFWVVAPGENIWSTLPPSNLGYMSGSSASSPHVTGEVALVAQAAPNLSPGQLAEVIKLSATDLGAPGVDGVYGNGLINVPAAVALATLRRAMPITPPPVTVAAPVTPAFSPWKWRGFSFAPLLGVTFLDVPRLVDSGTETASVSQLGLFGELGPFSAAIVAQPGDGPLRARNLHGSLSYRF